MNIKFLSIIVSTICLEAVVGFKVLGIFPYAGASHYFMFKPLLEVLSERGHDVTVVTYFPSNKTENLTYIDLDKDNTVKTGGLFDFSMNIDYYFKLLFYLYKTGTESCENVLKLTEIHELIRNNRTFDLVLTEVFNSDCALGIAYKLKTPVVGLSTCDPLPHLYKRMGVDRNPSYLPLHYTGYGKHPNFFQRIANMVIMYMHDLVLSYTQQAEEKMLLEFYDDIPPLEELAKDIKFYLMNHFFTLYGTKLYPSNVIEVGGIHVEDPKLLPKDIASFLDGADEAIYVSFGTMINPKTMPKETMYILIEVFNEIPQKIVWKWDTDVYSGNEKILVMNWVPQNDILAHPKVKLFISHAGMMGTTEAVHHGVAVVNIPIFADQPSNAAFIREHGFGVTVHWSDLTKENLLAAIQTTMTDEFQKRVKEHSHMWHDRLKSPMDTAVFWIEFAAKHPNVSFSNPAAFVPAYKFYMLDVLVSLILLICILWFLFKKVLFTRRINEMSKKKKSN